MSKRSFAESFLAEITKLDDDSPDRKRPKISISVGNCAITVSPFTIFTTNINDSNHKMMTLFLSCLAIATNLIDVPRLSNVSKKINLWDIFSDIDFDKNDEKKIMNRAITEILGYIRHNSKYKCVNNLKDNFNFFTYV